jgi:hypothetical protein
MPESPEVDPSRPDIPVQATMDVGLFTEQIWNGDSRFEVFLRGHLWIEHFLDRFLIADLVRPEALDLERFSWSRKLALCDALGLLSPWEVAAFGEMNRIRNKLAHDLAASPSSTEISNLIGRSPARFREAVAAVRRGEEKAGRLPSDADGSLADLRFWLFALAMDLDYRIETKVYESQNEEKLWRVEGLIAAANITKRPLTREEAERNEGLPPRPQPGDIFRRDRSDSA